MIRPTQAVILCGGLGTRLQPLTSSLPKPMVPIENNKPFLHYLLEQLSEQHIKRFVLLTGYMSEVIVDYFGDGKKWGWEISYSNGPVEWDTGRRIWEAKSELDECFILLYSDNFAAFSLENSWAMHQKSQSAITLMLKRKDTGNVSLGSNGVLQAYDKTRVADNLDYVELGYMTVERNPVLSAYADLASSPNISFSEVIKYLTDRALISGLVLATPYYSISDIERLEITRKHLSLQKIVLLDRDGTLHKRAPRGEYISKWEDVQILSEAEDGLKKLAAQGFKFIVISNQAGIGRGILSAQNVKILNDRISDYFQKIGVEILEYYLCPHHWEDNCECRKPLPGLFYQCAADYHIRLDRVLYIGDDPRDCQAATAAGSHCLYVGDAEELKSSSHVHQKVYSGILDTVEDVLKAYAF